MLAPWSISAKTMTACCGYQPVKRPLRLEPRSGKTARFRHVPDDPGSLSSDNQ